MSAQLLTAEAASLIENEASAWWSLMRGVRYIGWEHRNLNTETFSKALLPRVITPKFRDAFFGRSITLPESVPFAGKLNLIF